MKTEKAEEITAEKILDDYGCPSIPFDEKVTMYYPAIINAMHEFAEQRVREELIKFYEWEVEAEVNGVPVYATNKKEVPKVVDEYLNQRQK